MTRAIVLGALLALTPILALSASADDANFTTLHFSEHRQYELHCPANYECEIQLQPGERVSDGFNPDNADWDSHIGYTGTTVVTPHLLLRPLRAGLRTNIILTTTKRTYHFLATSTRSNSPMYYAFQYDDETYRRLAQLAIATQTALHPVGAPVATPTPADVADLRSVCIDYSYSYYQDRAVPNDHKPHEKADSRPIPPEWTPQQMCTDGKHTYVEFPTEREQPSDTPVYFRVDSDGDEVINATYNGARRRYTIDGVYADIALVLGSQDSPLRIRLLHNAPPAGRHQPVLIPIKVLHSPPPNATSSLPSPEPR